MNTNNVIPTFNNTAVPQTDTSILGVLSRNPCSPSSNGWISTCTVFCVVKSLVWTGYVCADTVITNGIRLRQFSTEVGCCNCSLQILIPEIKTGRGVGFYPRFYSIRKLHFMQCTCGVVGDSDDVYELARALCRRSFRQNGKQQSSDRDAGENLGGTAAPVVSSVWLSRWPAML